MVVHATLWWKTVKDATVSRNFLQGNTAPLTLNQSWNGKMAVVILLPTLRLLSKKTPRKLMPWRHPSEKPPGKCDNLENSLASKQSHYSLIISMFLCMRRRPVCTPVPGVSMKPAAREGLRAPLRQSNTTFFSPYNFLFTIFPRVANVYWHRLAFFTWCRTLQSWRMATCLHLLFC